LIRETKIREVLGVLQDRFENLGFRPRWKHKQQTGLEEKEFLGHIVPGNFGGNMAIVCWHGMDFHKSQTSKSHVKLTIESIPRKKNHFISRHENDIFTPPDVLIFSSH